MEGITGAQREAEGFWLSPDLLLGGGAMKESGEDQREVPLGGSFFIFFFRAVGHRRAGWSRGKQGSGFA